MQARPEAVPGRSIGSDTRVAICVCTYNRPAGVRKFLASVRKLEFKRIAAPAITVIVVENDARGEVVSTLHRDFGATIDGMRLIAEVESRPGIPHARNKCLDLARDARFIVFADDDEWASDVWLEELLLTQALFDADVVAGPVYPVFEVPPRDWIREGGFFDVVPLRTGAPITECGTGNVLIRSRIFSAPGPRFDARLAFSGGSDTLLFRQLHLLRKKMIWCSEAAVFEDVPAARANPRWLIKRAMRNGIMEARIAQMLQPGTPWPGLKSATFGGARILLGGAAALFNAPLLRKGRAVRALRRGAAGVGNIVGSLGALSAEYKR